ncbi:MAG: hypothetical protein A3F84_20675 [Candidatus Handelsmanbacteria bacterium RIFCSPLOWO2_12_FULL_64_10]|uniref:Type I restriction modification DNA specificity domain-containing protein n=1 Tax=Handelsmanbacteria sp. (strain RIFCSPLOWO2_12_FULL_64_10) TaxID=1817868 RepID=A0A1F6D2Q1_HANXR|nr:MAG: hypothetical protein A3F84_20675 [Candidatus Handelsmanbacteria bacterium RIFCSPLOWO2_12_FULL_64_10]
MAIDWVQTTLSDVEYFEPLGTGVKPFSGIKDYLSTSSIEGTRIAYVEEEVSFTRRPSRANLQPVPNSVFFARMRETCKVLEANNYLCERTILSTGFCGIRSERVVSAFLKQFVLSEAFERQKDNLAEGSTQAALTNAKLDLIRIAFPRSITEQAKIAEILSTVDGAIEQTEALIAKQQRIKIGLMQDLLTRGIDEHCNLRSEQTHEFKDSSLGRVPVVWDCVQFGSLMATSPTNGIYKPQSAYTDGGVPIVRIDGYKNGDRIESQMFKCVALSTPEITRYGLKAGDLLVNRVNSIDYLGKSALVGDLPQATVFESNMIRLRVDKRQLLPEFAIRILSSAVAFRHFQRLAKIAIAQTSINQQDVCSLWLKKPCIEEQARIVQVASACDACIGKLSDRQRKLRRIKTALMQDLLTGKRRVTALLSKTEARA